MSNNASAKLLFSKPGKPPNLKTALAAFLSSFSCRDARCAFAYVSLAGINESVGPLFELTDYGSLHKRWVVGINNGITEPMAIETLVNFPNSLVRIFLPNGSITKAALSGSEKLHPKVICLTGDTKSLFTIGSANLTRAALGVHSTNYEAGALIQTSDNVLHRAFNRWFEGIWNDSIKVTPNIIDRYSHIRELFLAENKIIAPRLDEMPNNIIRTRQHLWIEAGAMSGGDRNQIEFGPTLSAFFRQPKRKTIYLRMKWNDDIRNDRPLSYKVTQWNTEIWRLSMITSNQGGPSYPGQIIHFTRRRDHRGEFFELDVASPNSINARRWRKQANRKGTIAMTGIGTGSAREYGVY